MIAQSPYQYARHTGILRDRRHALLVSRHSWTDHDTQRPVARRDLGLPIERNIQIVQQRLPFG